MDAFVYFWLGAMFGIGAVLTFTWVFDAKPLTNDWRIDGLESRIGRIEKRGQVADEDLRSEATRLRLEIGDINVRLASIERKLERDRK